MSDPSTDLVDLVLNVFERTYRRALEPGSIDAIVADNDHDLARRVVLVNNVLDPADATARAERALARGEIDELHFVADRLEGALRTVGLSRRELEPLLHYSDGPLVAATLPGSPFFLYWDPEARLAHPSDWIAPALDLMRGEPQIMIANPSWELPGPDGRMPGVERETVLSRDGFAIGPGFSDQIFLASRASLAAPIYTQRCIADITYPAAHKARVFEARLGAHMRHHGRLRATALQASYVTDSPAGGSSYPPSGPLELVRYARNGATLRAIALTPWRPRCLKHTWL